MFKNVVNPISLLQKNPCSRDCPVLCLRVLKERFLSTLLFPLYSCRQKSAYSKGTAPAET